MVGNESFTYALIGNPNAGKTTLFNVLTGTSQHVGNWPGVTVEKKEGVLRSDYAFNEILVQHTDDMPDQHQPGIGDAPMANDGDAATAGIGDAPTGGDDDAAAAGGADDGDAATGGDDDAAAAGGAVKACDLGRKVTIVDLPGIYALSPYSIEERVSREYIVDDKPDVVIDILEATNIERNLYLTCQIAELGVPIVVAVNMMDEAAEDGIEIDTTVLSEKLGLPVVPITAVREEGIGMLMRAVAREAAHAPHFGEDEHGHGIYDDEDAAEHIRDHHTDAFGRSTALISAHLYHNHYKGPAVVQQAANEPLSETLETQNAEERYAFIGDVVDAAVTRRRLQEEETASDKIDKVVTNRWAAIPIFLLLIFIMFHCTFSSDFLGLSLFGLDPIPSPGVWLQDLMQLFVSWFSSIVGPLLPAGSWIQGLVVDGVIAGVGAVLSFLPQIMVLFFFLTLLEDVGYMSRAAFIMDRALRRVGLSGKSFMPMLMGFGCNVPAIMACRTMDDERDRKVTLFLIPFMSCGARTTVFLVFAAAFFPVNTDFIVLGLYLGGVLVAVLTGLLMKKLVHKDEDTPLIIELPRYRAPRAKSLGLALWASFKDYISRAGTVILLMSIVIWFLSNFGFADGVFGVVGIEDSLLAIAGGFIAPIFAPAGFGFWIAAVALLAGIAAKEAVVGTLGVLCSVSGSSAAGSTVLDAAALAAVGFTSASALSFMVFMLLYIPCAATLAAMAREANSWKFAGKQVAYGLVVAWALSVVVYQVAVLVGM